MKVIVAGGRDLDPASYQYWDILHRLHAKHGFTEIVSGGCSGADKIGEDFADRNGIKKKVVDAEWQNFSKPCIIAYKNGVKYNALSGPIRNEKMARYADACILLPGGRGTNSMRKAAKEWGIKILYDSEGRHDETRNKRNNI